MLEAREREMVNGLTGLHDKARMGDREGREGRGTDGKR